MKYLHTMVRVTNLEASLDFYCAFDLLSLLSLFSLTSHKLMINEGQNLLGLHL